MHRELLTQTQPSKVIASLFYCINLHLQDAFNVRVTRPISSS